MHVYALNIADKNINPLAQISTFADVLNVLIPIVMVVVGLIFFFMLIAGAFSWLTSAGTPEKLKKPRALLHPLLSDLLLSFVVILLLS